MKVAIIGQGYVGLPLAVAAANSGYQVVGFDLNSALVENLKAGRSHIEDIPGADIAGLGEQDLYVATDNPELISDCEIAIIAVPTPLDGQRRPDLSFVKSAAEILGKSLSKSSLIINESTSYPGTLREIIAPIVEANKLNGLNHSYAISPERVDPGNQNWKIKNTPRLYAGLTPEASKSTREFYEKFCDNLVEVETPEIAESAKLFENTFRQVNIALVNEFALIMRALNIPVHDVLDAANSKPYGFMKFNPGIGVGGHCIPVDPSYLAFAAEKAGVEPRFINLANQVNLEMPRSLVKRILSEFNQNLNGKRILICGVAYKSNISDTRESPAKILYDELINSGANVSWYDPNVKFWYGLEPVDIRNSKFDISIITVMHSSMNIENIRNSAPYLFDCTGRLPGVPTL